MNAKQNQSPESVVKKIRRKTESLDNMTPADVYTGRAVKIVEERQRIKQRTMKLKKANYRKAIVRAVSMS